MPSSCKSKYSILYNQLFACLISLVKVNQLQIVPGQFSRIERNDGNVWLFLLQKEDARTLHLEGHDHCKGKYEGLLSTSSYLFFGWFKRSLNQSIGSFSCNPHFALLWSDERSDILGNVSDHWEMVTYNFFRNNFFWVIN